MRKIWLAYGIGWAATLALHAEDLPNGCFSKGMQGWAVNVVKDASVQSVEPG